ncbi:hypothetical protein MHYP_G00342970 [Metynnis hypsauchen]
MLCSSEWRKREKKRTPREAERREAADSGRIPRAMLFSARKANRVAPDTQPELIWEDKIRTFGLGLLRVSSPGLRMEQSRLRTAAELRLSALSARP